MPYLHCQACRFTIFRPRALMEAPDARSCPTCGGRLADKAKPLFASRPPLRRVARIRNSGGNIARFHETGGQNG